MILNINAKVSDLFAMYVADDEGVLLEYDGYIPEELHAIGGGDYITISIDMDTGKIIDWESISLKDLNEAISASS